jgi:hypothetical protein
MKNKTEFLRCGITIFLMLFSKGLAGQIPVQNLVKKDIKIAKGQRFLNFPVNIKDQLVRATIRLNGVPLD